MSFLPLIVGASRSFCTINYTVTDAQRCKNQQCKNQPHHHKTQYKSENWTGNSSHVPSILASQQQQQQQQQQQRYRQHRQQQQARHGTSGGSTRSKTRSRTVSSTSKISIPIVLRYRSRCHGLLLLVIVVRGPPRKLPPFCVFVRGRRSINSWGKIATRNSIITIVFPSRPNILLVRRHSCSRRHRPFLLLAHSPPTTTTPQFRRSVGPHKFPPRSIHYRLICGSGVNFNNVLIMFYLLCLSSTIFSDLIPCCFLFLIVDVIIVIVVIIVVVIVIIIVVVIIIVILAIRH